MSYWIWLHQSLMRWMGGEATALVPEISDKITHLDFGTDDVASKQDAARRMNGRNTKAAPQRVAA